MVQKVKGKRTWSIFLILGLASFISSSLGLSSFPMLVLTPGGLEMRLVLLALLAGLFSIEVMQRLVVLTLGEFSLFIGMYQPSTDSVVEKIEIIQN